MTIIIGQWSLVPKYMTGCIKLREVLIHNAGTCLLSIDGEQTAQSLILNWSSKIPAFIIMKAMAMYELLENFGEYYPKIIQDNQKEGFLYQNGLIEVSYNNSDELFIKTKKGNVLARITPNVENIAFTASQGILEPWMISGLPAFKIREAR